MEKIWGYDKDVEMNVVWVYISYLRKKLQTLQAPGNGQSIWNSFQFSAETPFETRYFSASTTDGGETWTTDVSHIASATESEAEEYAAKVAEKGKTETVHHRRRP